MSLFQPSVLKKHLSPQDTVQVQSQKKAFYLKSQIATIDKEIDQMAYGLSKGEISIIENN